MKKIVWIILTCFAVLSLVLASCSTTVEEEEEEEGPPAGGDWWDKFGEPEYGGTITYQVTSLQLRLDPQGWWSGQYEYTGDLLFQRDWTLDPKIWDFKAGFTPAEYTVGQLAESWEWQDPQTMVVHLRQGVHWQDKPLVNGREFTAYDVEYHYDRLLGTGHGFTERNSFYGGRIAALEKVTATDKYTVVIKFSYASAWGIYTVFEQAGQNYFEAPEWVEQGDLTNWETLVGTGPFILTDYVDGSSQTYIRNPDYWGYDERHPQNQIPYIDNFRMLCIPDIATALAGLRTGKIDKMDQLSWEQAASLARTNPELIQEEMPGNGPSLEPRVDKEPFTDIKVRKAMQLALDRKTLAATLYGGIVEGEPCGALTPVFKGYYFAYEDWPKELKDEYSYNPEQARELLAEAGYPNGFSTVVETSTSGVLLDVLEAIKAYFMDIGIDLEIKTMDPTALMALQRAKQHTIRYDTRTAMVIQPGMGAGMRYSTDPGNSGCANDPAYDAMFDEFNNTTDMDEAKRLLVQMYRYDLEQHWGIKTFATIKYNFYQPYLKGYSGEHVPAAGTCPSVYAARFWVDQDLKESMGR